MPCRHHQRIKHLSLRHQRKHQHTHHQNKPQHYHHHHHHHQLPQDLKGKSAATCSPATPPAPASAPPHLPPACACDVLAPGSLTGGSLTNLSTSHEPEPEFDVCPCDECFACAPPSTSATASTLLADECYSQTASSMLSARLLCTVHGGGDSHWERFGQWPEHQCCGRCSCIQLLRRRRWRGARLLLDALLLGILLHVGAHDQQLGTQQHVPL